MDDKTIKSELLELSRQPLTAGGAPFASHPHAKAQPDDWRSRFSRLFVFGCIFGLAALLYWASRSELEQVVRGTGHVIPDTSTQVIQSLEGGIVSELKVKQGDRVQKGDVLLRLHDKQFSSRFQENVAQRDVLEARVVRLLTEVQGRGELKFSEELEKRRPDVIEKERLLFEKRRQDEMTKASSISAKLEQVKKKLAFLTPAINAGSISQLDRMELETEMVTLRGLLETGASNFARDAMEHYDQEQAKLESLIESIKADADRLERTTIHSPVTGVVNAIFAESEGRVVKSGDPIMEVVPEGDSLLVEAQIRPEDIAFISAGQPVHVRFTAYDFAAYGGLDGKVETIGVDTISGPRGEKFYPIRVRTKTVSMGEDRRTGEALMLKPGMVAEVDILTGRKTIAQYILSPIERARQRALRER